MEIVEGGRWFGVGVVNVDQVDWEFMYIFLFYFYFIFI